MTEAAGQNGRGVPEPRGGQFDLVLQQLDSLAVQPTVATDILQTACRISDGMDRAERDQAESRLAEWIRGDPALVVRVLQAAAEAGTAQAESIDQAIEAVGLDRLRPLLLALHLPPARAACPIDPAALTHHSQAVALAAEQIARHDRIGVDPAQAFLAGLLHDIGKLALLEAFPKAYARALDAARVHRGNLLEYERLILGIDHVVFGRRLAEKWRLPEAIAHSIWLHHQPFEAIPASLRHTELIGVVHAANAISRIRRIGVSGDLQPPGPMAHLARSLGLPAAELETLAADLEQRVESFRHGRGLDAPADMRSLYRAQIEANLELGRIFHQLQQDNLRQHQAAQLYRHAENLLGQLNRDSTLPEAMITAAETFSRLLGGPVVAYWLKPGQSEVLLGRYREGQVQWRCLARRSGPARAMGDQAPAPAEQVVGQLLAEPDGLADWLSQETIHLPLAWSGRWSGGLFVEPDPRGERLDQARKLAEMIGRILGLVQDRAGALALSDELAGTSANLAATQRVLAEQTTLTAVGQMAAGAAHELNTPLAVISGRAQLMKERAGSPADRKVWSQVAEQAQTISDIISDLMDFASPSPPRPTSFAVAGLLDEAIGAFSASKHPQASAVSFDKSIGENLPSVHADPDQIRSAILELITNAANASPAGGRIRVCAEVDPTGATVLVRIQDTGTGMDEQTLANAYTPFFSAHQAGRRRGLGLPRAKRYVEASGGRIWIQSRSREGTSVFVQLPTAQGPQHRGVRHGPAEVREDPGS